MKFLFIILFPYACFSQTITQSRVINLIPDLLKKVNIIDSSTLYQTKFRGDTARLNLYTEIAGKALTSNPLSQFAATTSAQLAGIISDEVGTDKLVYNTSPTLVTPVLGAATATSLGISSTPDASSLLDVVSTTKGILIPRQTVAQINAISSPANGLTAYNTDDSTETIYKGTWENTPRIPRSSSIVTVDDTTTLDPGAGMPSTMKVWANANKRYRVTVSLWTVCSGTGGVCTGLSGPAGSAVLSGVWAGTAATSSTTMQGTRSPAMNSTTTIGFNKIAAASGSQTFIGYITTSSTAGFITLTFRSLTLGQTSTLKVGSTMDLTEVQ